MVCIVDCLLFFFLWSAALTKSMGLRADARIDDRSYWITRTASLSASLAIPLVYPRLFAVHNLPSKVLPKSCEIWLKM